MQAFSAKVFKSCKFSAIFGCVAIVSAFTLADTANINAQRKPIKKTVKTKPQPPATKVLTSTFTNYPDACIPPETDYVSVLQFDNNAKATLTVQTNEGSKLLFDANELSSANDVLTAIFSKSTLTVKPDPSLKLDLVVKILKGARQSLDRCINVEASTDTLNPYIYIYPEPKEQTNLDVKPNPLILVVELDENANLTLNNEAQGSLNDTSMLKNRLKQIFKSREDNGVFREGTNLIEKTVSVKAVSSAKFGDLVKMVDALKEAGASPIGLLIDDNVGPFIIDIGKDLIINPVINEAIPQSPETRSPKRRTP